ncbi:MAG: DUF642 domain-containing protein [Bryobacteraceae bacterium]|nr:DUF642 domain-containing protein [Bryobacteraceae bacterium]
MKDFRISHAALSLLAPFLLLATPAFTQELVTNGGFETPNITPDQSRFPVTVPGWSVIGAAGLELQRGVGGATAYEGAQWAELDITSNTTIFQDLATVPGQQYLLRYSVANRPGVASSAVRVSWGGAVIDEHTVSAQGWLRVIKLVQATAPTTRIQFEARGASDSQGDWLDAVSVTVPGANVIQNGSFESPVIGAVSANVVVSNWTSSGPGGTSKIDRGLEGILAADGQQWVELDGVGNTNIYQDVASQAGQRYLLTFAVANRQGSAGSSVRVVWNGQSQGVFSNVLAAFQTFRLELTAGGPSQRLEFQAAGTQDGTGDLLDAVMLQPILVAGDLNSTYRIRVKSTGRFLHEDGNNDRLVSTRFQPDDDFTRFVPEKQTDGSYRLRVKANGRYLHEDALGDRLVSTRLQPDDDNTRFFFELQTDSSYRIRAKGSNRYLYEDNSDRLVSTRNQPNDDSSRFFLDAAGAVPGTSLTSLPSSLAFNFTLGGAQPPSQSVAISSIPTGASFTVDQPSVNWLTVAPLTGTAPTSLLVSVNPTGLAQGTITTTITVRSTDALPVSIPVTLTVSGGSTGAVLQASPSSLTFNFSQGGATPASQGVTISSTPTGAAYTVDQPSVSWLLVSPLSGTTLSTLTVAVNPTGLQVGTISSQITIRAAGALPITIPVTLNVTTGGSTGSILVASPAAISATFQPGGVQPGAQSVTLSSTTGSSSFTVDTPQVSWLSVTPTSGTAPTVLTVLFNTAGLSVGTFSTQVIVRPTGLGSTSPLAIPVTLTVGSGGGTTGSAQVIAQMADGAGWQTQIILVNRDTQAAQFTLRFFTSAGQPLNLAIEGEGSPLSTFIGTIPVGGTRTITSAGTSTQLSVGWVELTSSQSVGGVSVFRSVPTGQEAAVGLTSATSRFLLPYDNTNGRVTSMAIVNTNATQPVAVNVILRDEFGGTLGTSTLNLGVRGHDAFELVGRFSVVAGRRGVAEFSTTGSDITGLGLRFSPQGAFTSFPVQPR